MNVEMKARSTLEELDDFLRGEWLECCGHLSDFEIGGTTYTVPRAYRNEPFGIIEMSRSACSRIPTSAP
jgi:hypothetical protein